MTRDEREAARAFAERGLREQQAGKLKRAEASLEQAMQLDPDVVAEVLHQTGADTAPDARDNGTDRDVTPPEAFRETPI
jgi:Tfp pilus assembly protein PilF